MDIAGEAVGRGATRAAATAGTGSGGTSGPTTTRPHPGSRRTRLALRLVATILAGSLTAATPGRPADDVLVAFVGTTRHPLTLLDPARPRFAWPASPVLSDRLVAWTPVRPGLERAELSLTAGSRSLETRVTLFRVEPAAFRFDLVSRTRSGGTLGGWSATTVTPDVGLAFNAGQFDGGRPWGWLVRGGLELEPPGEGPLSSGVVIDTAGAVRIIDRADIPFYRFRPDVATAFQSYPTILTEGGTVPAPIRAPGRGVDLDHRDIRFALGQLEDGRLLLAITRFGSAAGFSMPWGPTVPEMAALMGALGARQAVLLDGGLSAQLAARDTAGDLTILSGLRRVPLALEARPR